MTLRSGSQSEITPARLFLIVFFIILSSTCLLSFPVDDGLRHVGVAFSGIVNWGDVYPFSYFTEYCDYSPWYGYDLLLRKSLSLFQYIPLNAIVVKFFFVKALSVVLVLIIFLMLVLKSKILSEIQDYESLLPLTLCVLFFLVHFFLRSMIIRPFVFGTIFLIYSFQQSGFWKGIISSSALIFLYPYLSWFYILPVAFCHFFKGNKRFAYGTLIPLAVFFIFQTPSFWKLQAVIIAGDALRKQMGVNVSELVSTVNSFYCLSILLGLILLYPILHEGQKKINYGDLLLLTYLLPAVIYIRTFTDIFLPLAFVTYSKTLIPYFKNCLLNAIACWKTYLRDVQTEVVAKLPQSLLKRIKSRSLYRPGTLSLKPFIVVLFAMLIFIDIKINMDQLKNVNETESQLSAIPKSSTILSSFNQQYRFLFVRPDLKIIPSCDITWPSPAIRNEYIDFFKSGSFLPLAIKTSAAYLVEAEDMYFDPRDSRNLQFISNHEKLKIWKILN